MAENSRKHSTKQSAESDSKKPFAIYLGEKVAEGFRKGLK